MPTPSSDDPLFSAADLSQWLGKTVSDTRAAVVEQTVWGWLRPALGADTRPQPVPPEVFSWAIELGGIAHENPAGLSRRQLGSMQQEFSAERQAAILSAAAAGSSMRPRGNFPLAPRYPDPAQCYPVRW